MIYVDDLLKTSEDDAAIDDTKKLLAEKFDISDLGKVNHLLGIKFENAGSSFIMKL